MDGRLVDVSLRVPPGFEKLAEIERRRPEEGLFPMFLDRNGNLREIALAQDSAATSQAAQIVRSRLDKLPLSAFDKAESRNFVTAVASAPATSSWPATVFSPAPGRQQETRSMPLDDGRTGSITVVSDAEVEPGSSLLRRLSRVVTTKVGSSTQRTDENWTLRRN